MSVPSPAAPILAKSIYRELRSSGLQAEEVIAIASELLGLVSAEVRERRAAQLEPETPIQR